MRFLTLASLLMAFSLSCKAFAQDEASILKGASQLYDANYNMDFEPIAELTYPKVVEQLGGKEKFLTKLDGDYQNDKFRKRLQLTAPVFQLNAVKSIDGHKFCVISYRNPTRYFYEQPLGPEDMKKEVAGWKTAAATQDVFAEPNRNSINVKRISKIVGVSDAATANEWKFFNLDDLQQLEAFNTLFASQKSQIGL